MQTGVLETKEMEKHFKGKRGQILRRREMKWWTTDERKVKRGQDKK